MPLIYAQHSAVRGCNLKMQMLMMYPAVYLYSHLKYTEDNTVAE
jgi:hypothetical protein